MRGRAVAHGDSDGETRFRRRVDDDVRERVKYEKKNAGGGAKQNRKADREREWQLQVLTYT